MKKIILFICILIGVSSCSYINYVKQYTAKTKNEGRQDKIGRELLEKNTQKIVWNEMELIVPENTTIDTNGRLNYNNQELEIEFKKTNNREELCRNKSYKIQWFKKYNEDYVTLGGYRYDNLKYHSDSNLKLAERIAIKNKFSECR
ncbi:membrane lipoprotein lipid attachment site-containing protein [Leptotrichia sp. HSP-342]|uniref:Membrane lipoprotein lipid attachment site-containing protein n=1 Tax=Leptotrichia mesophila TaxID=3239303 RepID=A0AB39VDV9_9FUSO